MTNRTMAEQFQRDQVLATRALASLVLNDLPEQVRSRVHQAVHDGTGYVELRTRIETGQVELVLVPKDGSEPFLDRTHFEEGVIACPMNHSLLRDLVMSYGDLPDFVGIDITSVATKSNFGNYLLNIAASRGDRDIVLALLEAGADINAPGDEGYTPLHDAAEQGREEIVKILLCRGAARTALNRMGDKPADTARACGNPNVAAMIDDYAG